MKILTFSLMYHPFVGGAEIAVKELMSRMKEHEFDIVTLRMDTTLPKYEEHGNVRIHRIGFSAHKPAASDLIRFPLYINKILFPLTGAIKALMLMRKKHYDFLWSIMSYMAFPAFFVSIITNKPYVLNIQDGDSVEHITDRWRIKPVYMLLKFAFRRADFVQVISHFLATFARALGYQGPIAVIPNGVNIELFSKEIPAPELEGLRHEIRAKLPRHSSNEDVSDVSGDEVFLVTTSRLVVKNGISDLISSLEHLPAHIKLLIAGTGPDMMALQSLAVQLRVETRVLFLGHIENEDLPKYLKAFDIFIRPSLSEGMGISFIEAMAAGIPVIATPVGGIVDFLKDGETGYVCEPNSPKSIAEKVQMILINPALKDKVITNARALVEKNYDWSLVAERMRHEVFEKIKTNHE